MAKKTFTEGDRVIVTNPWTGDKSKAIVVGIDQPVFKGSFCVYGGELLVRFVTSTTEVGAILETARIATEDVTLYVPFCDVDKDQTIEDEHMRQGSL